jgi:hypothetical protein
MARGAIVRALDALELGDARQACEILLGAIEDCPEQPRRFACSTCGLSFAWPGERDHHALMAHDYEAAA